MHNTLDIVVVGQTLFAFVIFNKSLIDAVSYLIHPILCWFFFFFFCLFHLSFVSFVAFSFDQIRSCITTIDSRMRKSRRIPSNTNIQRFLNYKFGIQFIIFFLSLLAEWGMSRFLLHFFFFCKVQIDRTSCSLHWPFNNLNDHRNAYYLIHTVTMPHASSWGCWYVCANEHKTDLCLNEMLTKRTTKLLFLR